MLNEKFRRMRIECAADGKDALAKYASFYPQLILMDIRLPGENGLELTRKIRCNNKDVIIVILTSHDAPEYRQAADRNGANYFVSKSTTSSEELMDLVELIVTNKPDSAFNA